jgi:hypothetical protein
MSSISVNEILNLAKDDLPDNLVGVTPKAWVRFDGTGTVIKSFKVNSVVRNTLGNFTITLEENQGGANYLVFATGSTPVQNVESTRGTVSYLQENTATTVRIINAQNGDNGVSANYLDGWTTSVMIFDL